MRKIPAALEVLLAIPLYTKLSADDSEILSLRNYRDTIDCYCVSCRDSSVFKREDETPSQMASSLIGIGGGGPYIEQAEVPFFFDMIFQCSRDPEHKLVFYFRKFQSVLMKVGEYPSRADRVFPELRKFEKNLGEYFNDYKQASFLFSHGVGIGSFAYLRRVFEKIVDDTATEKFAATEGWELDKWKSEKRMHEQLEDLKDVLPDFLVENSFVWSVLSKGIHELEEDECLKAFGVVNAVIEEILEDRLSRKQKELRRKELRSQLTQIKSDMDSNAD
ncbi:MAG: hypothetical protein IIC78_14545 [Chloroflexi bacterium]|nr:hypothetical protein [Chloroflexota bacterium]